MGPEDQHPWDREDEEIRAAFAAKDAEIARLKAENDSLIEQFKAIRETCYAKDKLITELADALKVHSVREPVINELLQRARKEVPK
jgi:hypothetical protein